MPKLSTVTANASAERIKGLMRAGRLREAVLTAAKFRDLGEARDRVLSAREAYQRPDFQRSIGKDPDLLIADGVLALQERYGA